MSDHPGKQKLDELVARADEADRYRFRHDCACVNYTSIRSISDAYTAMEAENERLRALIAAGDDAHRSIVKEAAWPDLCYSPGSCSRHKQCMYTNCPYEGQSIKAEIDATLKGYRREG